MKSRPNHPTLRSLALCFLVASGASACLQPGERHGPAAPAARPERSSYEEATAGFTRRSGFLPVWINADEGRLLLELPARAQGSDPLLRCLHIAGLESGLGSNPVGLDRGQLGSARLVEFQRHGSKVFLVAPNLMFRADGAAAAEQRAARESFATSVLWSSPILAESDEGTALVDLTSLLVSDRHRVASALARADQGSYRLDEKRSALLAADCLSFPDNLEFASLLTFAGSSPGSEVRRTTPVGESVSLVQHQSLIRLPGPGFIPRRGDPRVGTLDVTYTNVAAPLTDPVNERLTWAHRASAGEPIVYYVDRGAPEPVRTALVEGASWWSSAFAAAGLPGGFRVELLPPDAHPLDVRFNVIQWVHRAQRGWSYGSGIVDPRTGEVLKGHVTLGALRVRQDRLLFEGLLGAAATGSGTPRDPVQLALARLRQLAAHEVGHTLGLAHNFAASTDGRASVMDYPAPLVEIGAGGGLDVSAAYGVGVGAWDEHVIRYLYSPLGANPTPSEVEAQLDRIAAAPHGLAFASDADARSLGSAHPLAHLWDNGSDPIADLERTVRVRAAALKNFGPGNLAAGRPLAELEEVFVPVYLHHRYAAEACAKWVGGFCYSSGAGLESGTGQSLQSVPAERARAAIEALVATLQPNFLDIPDTALDVLVPRAFGMRRNVELFESDTSPGFDAIGAARSAAEIVLAALLDSRRCGRLVDAHRRDDAQPGLRELLETISSAVFDAPPKETMRRAELRSAAAGVFVQHLIALLREAPPQVRARVELVCDELLAGVLDAESEDGYRRMYRRSLLRVLGEGPQSAPLPGAAVVPPGSPIGSGKASRGLDGVGHGGRSDADWRAEGLGCRWRR